jgi:hypothetical protein
MASLGGFNPDEHDTDQSVTLPEGILKLNITDSSDARTKSDTGTILKLTIEVLAPAEIEGRKWFHNINIENDNPIAQRIGQEELAKLCRAIGVRPTDSEDLHHKEFTAKVGLDKKQDGYDQKNKFTRFYYPDEGEVPEPALAAPVAANDNRKAANDNKAKPAAAATKPAAAAAGAKLPWVK